MQRAPARRWWLVPVLVLIILLAAASSAAGAREAHQAACPQMVLIGARGSGESDTSKTHGMGPVVSYMADRLAGELRGNREVMRTLPVIYSALSVDVLRPSKAEIASFAVLSPAATAAYYYVHNVKPYLASIEEGVNSTISEAAAEVAACPHTDLILAGYSQGAIVVHQAELRLEDGTAPPVARPLDTEVLNRIVGTLLVADGDRVRYSEEALFGSASAGDQGVQVAIHGIAARDVGDPGGTVQVCDAQDIVCDFSLSNIRSLKRAAHAAAVHTSYLDHDKHNLNLAVDWLHRLLTRPYHACKPTGLLSGVVLRARVGVTCQTALAVARYQGTHDVLDPAVPPFRVAGRLWRCEIASRAHRHTLMACGTPAAGRPSMYVDIPVPVS